MQEPPGLDDTLELREQLAQAWRAVLDAAVERGSPPQAVVETMASVAHERFAALFGASAAASYLQLLAEQLRDVDHDEATVLVRGDEAPAAAAEMEEPALDPAWIDARTWL
ncbi:hypothetical protein [Methylobacterium oryzisoli]|uniref:hypothetical protein n=1 Tax=Methylobacterium oryzisoli TaxID=3385502 RepID=UPI003891E656